MFSPIQQARYIDVSISEFRKHAFENFQLSWFDVMFLDISFTIVWRCKLKSPQNGNLKKRIIHFNISKHNTHDLYDLYFRKGVLSTNEHSQCEGKNSIDINEP